jgi:hypothetical protein
MTPKEKATQLCDSFYQKLPLEMHVTTTDGDLSWEYNSWKNSKQCALIAVDEILSMGIMSDSGDWRMAKSYWEEVKQEIEKL